ncbi:phosphatidate cytidylyltransferase [Helicobacter bizzozeronii]|uniref:phosphatidate cytidylyltransferase n=1 Tax=Helicobacter bizzozeronii TaxID=56877 RepID=UPI000CEE1E84|nr:phosphatidate cytidylyltransferase [Helicobacter bizzozeronii]
MKNFREKVLADKTRYITGAFLILLAIVVFYLNDLFVFWAVLGVIFLVCFHETLRLHQKLYNFGFNKFYYLIAVLVWVLAYFNQRPVESALFVGILLAGILAYRTSNMQKSYVLVYPAVPFLCLFALFKDFGVGVVIWLVVVVVVADVGAYFGGRLFGTTPLSAASPNKSLEGALIGFVFSSLIGGIVGLESVGSKKFLPALGISALTALSSILGDLYESYLKRRVGVKDSGHILPGHGGMLDRFDAMLFGAIALHFLLLF